jgi:hypothetical protein
MNTFFRNVLGRRDSVLIIKDSGGHVFGAMIPFAWQQAKTKKKISKPSLQ